jgi:hypothetical protein
VPTPHAPRAFDLHAERDLRRLIRASTLSLAHQKVAGAILDHLDEHGNVYCSVRTLARECHANVHTVIATTAKLIAIGFMVKTGVRVGLGGTPVYKLIGQLDSATQQAPNCCHPVATVQDSGTVATFDANCCHFDTRTVATFDANCCHPVATRGDEGSLGDEGISPPLSPPPSDGGQAVQSTRQSQSRKSSSLGQWWKTDRGIEAKAREVGISGPRPGEERDDAVARIYAKIGESAPATSTPADGHDKTGLQESGPGKAAFDELRNALTGKLTTSQ